MNAPQFGLLRDAAHRLLKDKASRFALCMIAFIIIMSIVGPMLNPYGYNEQRPEYANMPPRIPGLFSGERMLAGRAESGLSDSLKYPPGSVLEIVRRYESRGTQMCDVRVDYYRLVGISGDVNFWFGTDYLGRDLWTRVWRGARVSLAIAFSAVLLNTVIGVAYGAAAGYLGGRADIIMMRFAEIIEAFPQVVVATMLVLVIGTGIGAIILALAIRGWVGTAKLMRAQTLKLKSREYVLAARTMGTRGSRLIARHILPNSISPLITRATLEVPSAIFAEAFLAYIGLGLQAPEPSIGVLLSDAQRVLISYPYQTVFPAMLISLLMISFNLVGNGLRDAFDPVSRVSK